MRRVLQVGALATAMAVVLVFSLVSVALRADDSAAAPSATAAPSAAGLSLQVSDIVDRANKPSAGAPAAVTIVAARNGTFSGKVVASSPTALRGLKATGSDLVQRAAGGGGGGAGGGGRGRRNDSRLGGSGPLCRALGGRRPGGERRVAHDAARV